LGDGHRKEGEQMGQVRHLAKHLLMCAPMLVVAGVLVASGVGVIAILPVLACVLMMTLMMGAMGRSGGQG
jgi:hypothetical protein